MTILAVLIPAVVAAGLAAIVHRASGLWLVQRPAMPSRAARLPM